MGIPVQISCVFSIQELNVVIQSVFSIQELNVVIYEFNQYPPSKVPFKQYSEYSLANTFEYTIWDNIPTIHE